MDRSPAMLQIARERDPEAALVEADMASYRTERRFDVVACVYDSLNHLASADDWQAVFDRTAEHLADGDIFHFDVNTVEQLRRLAEATASVYDFDGHTLVMDVRRAPAPSDGRMRTTWHLRVFEALHGRRSTLHETTIAELGLPLDKLTERLRRHFEIPECVDGDGAAAIDDADRAHVTCTLRTT